MAYSPSSTPYSIRMLWAELLVLPVLERLDSGCGEKTAWRAALDPIDLVLPRPSLRGRHHPCHYRSLLPYPRAHRPHAQALRHIPAVGASPSDSTSDRCRGCQIRLVCGRTDRRAPAGRPWAAGCRRNRQTYSRRFGGGLDKDVAVVVANHRVIKEALLGLRLYHLLLYLPVCACDINLHFRARFLI